MIFGLLFGLLGGPLILYGLGSVIVYFKTKNQQKQVQAMRSHHNKQIEDLKKQYEKDRKKFNNINRKMQRILAKVKKQEA